MVERPSGLQLAAAAAAAAGVAAAVLLRRRAATQARKGQCQVDAQGRMAAGRQKVERVPLEFFPPTRNDILLRAARGEATERVPVWIMRQVRGKSR